MRFLPLSIAAALLAVSLALPVVVSGQTLRDRARPVDAWRMDVLVQGAARSQTWSGGDAFVEGRIGERYVVRVHNPSWRRVEAVLSVDGRDAIDGQPSSWSKRGYVIAPYSYVDIDGFRLSMSEVAAFRFTTVPDSYASRMGTPWNVGVIEVALFPERVPPRMPRPAPLSRRSPSAGADQPSAERDEAQRGDRRPGRAQGLGTEFGETRSSLVSETSFVRESWGAPASRLRVRYDDRNGLCRRGLQEFCPRPVAQPPYYDPYYDPYYEPTYPPRRFSAPPPGWSYDR